MIFGLILLGFIIAVAFSAFHKTDTSREMIGNIVISIIAALQGQIFSSLLLLDNVPVSRPLALTVWIIGILYLKKLLLHRKDIKYLG